MKNTHSLASDAHDTNCSDVSAPTANTWNIFFMY